MKKFNRLILFNASLGNGGLEKTFADICNEYYLLDLDFDVIIFKNSPIKKFLNKKISIVEINSFSRCNIFAYINLSKLLKNNIVHTHGAKATQIAYYISKFIDITLIATKHNSRKGKIFNKIKNVTAVSKDVSKTIKNQDPKIIYNGLTYYNELKQDTKNNTFNIIAIGRLEKIKGFDNLINSLKDLNESFKLTIIGEGIEKESLQILIEKNDLQNNVELIGYKDNIIDYISSSHLVVISSLSEGFSLVAIETLFYGRLLVSTDVGICKEILDDDLKIYNNCFKDKFEDIINNYEKYIKKFDIIKEEYMDLFEIRNIAKQYMDLYTELGYEK